MHRPLFIIAATAAVLGGAGCSLDKLTAPPDVEHTSFATELGVDLSAMTKTASGLYYQDLTVGTGAVATVGQQMTVDYTGWLADGTKFDSSIDRGEPFQFTLGDSQLISGWNEGIAGMKVGGTRKLVMPPALGYGSSGRVPIPPNAVLVFDIQLLSIP